MEDKSCELTNKMHVDMNSEVVFNNDEQAYEKLKKIEFKLEEILTRVEKQDGEISFIKGAAIN